jgi:YidC/Oxa1 family membrane protein insertase
MEQRNLFLAIALSVIILLGSQLAIETFFPSPPPQTTAGDAVDGTALPGAPTAEGVPAAPGTVAAPGTQLGVQVPAREETLAASARLRIETDRLTGSIALTGARIDDLVLRDYKVTIEPDSPNVVLFSPSGTARGYYAQFGWVPADSSVKVPDENSVWTTGADVLTQNAPVTLSWDNGEGLTFERIITLDEGYMFTVNDRVRATGDTTATLFPYGLLGRDGVPFTSGFFILHEGPIGVFNETLEEVDYDTLQEDGEAVFNSTGGWVGMTDKYWLAALVPDQANPMKARLWHRLSANGRDKFQTDFLNENGKSVSASQPIEVTTHLYAGAKEVALLEQYKEAYKLPLFDRAVDFGWLWFFTKPLFHALDWLYGIVGNFGIAIMILTLGVKLLFFPLANKSYKAMSKMKLLQPEMTKLRERYPDDRQKMQQEMMAMYKREKVNPAAGCIPILIQIPVFFALYKVLFVSIEMRHAPFFGWIQDLSAKDPSNVFELFGLVPWGAPDFLHFGVWPLVMGATMFIQQRLNPQPADPVQAKIFMFMPLIFTVFLASFPAGLVVYWAWNNTLSIAQQWIIMRKDRQAAKAKKKASGGSPAKGGRAAGGKAAGKDDKDNQVGDAGPNDAETADTVKADEEAGTADAAANASDDTPDDKPPSGSGGRTGGARKSGGQGPRRSGGRRRKKS